MSGTVIMLMQSWDAIPIVERSEAAVVILLNGHAVELSSKYLCLHL